MSMYRKKPVVIEALQLNGQSVAVSKWLADNNAKFRFVTDPTDSKLDVVYISTLEGEMRADPGDFIIKGVQDEFYPCKPDIFAATYEPVDG